MRVCSLLIIFMTVNLPAKTLGMPDWVPERKRVAWVRFIRSYEDLERHSKDYEKALKAKPVIDSCVIHKKDQIIVSQHRHTIKTKITIGYTLDIEACIIGEYGLTVTFKPPQKKRVELWNKIKNIAQHALIVVVSLGVGYLIGRSSK